MLDQDRHALDVPVPHGERSRIPELNVSGSSHFSSPVAMTTVLLLRTRPPSLSAGVTGPVRQQMLTPRMEGSEGCTTS